MTIEQTVADAEPTPVDTGRRSLLKAAGGLVIGFTWLTGSKAMAFAKPTPQPGDAALARADGNPAFAPNAFIRIGTDGSIRLVMPEVEMGQGAYTGQATLLAVPRTHIANLETALKAAQLKPFSLSPGIAALHPPEAAGVLALSVGAGSIDLQVTCGGGIAALRFVEGATESEGTQKRLDADVAAREIRITLGQ